jgi:ATP phosphoribosyltransferase
MSCGERLRIGLPKGSLEAATVELLAKAGFRLRRSEREYRPQIDDPSLEARLIRAQELARYVAQGFLDCGITGKDWVLETQADVVILCELAYNKSTKQPARWVLAVAEDSPYRTVQDLAGKRIATEAVNLVQAYLRRHGVEAQVEFSWGATEVKVPELVDAIVDLTETGASLRANNLRVLDVVLESYPQFIAHPASWKNSWKRKKMEAMVTLLQGALQARDKVGLKMNAPKARLPVILERLPALRKPTISQLADPEWIALETVLDEEVVRELIPELKALGAEGIIEYPLNKVIY